MLCAARAGGLKPLLDGLLQPKLNGEEMKHRIALLSLVIFLFLPANAFAQTPSDAFSLSISVEQTAFESGHKANFSGGRIDLKRYGCHKTRCIRDECFSAGFSFHQEKRLKSGESVEFEVDLSTLHWAEMLSMIIDPTE
jgi:hypothetical protein